MPGQDENTHGTQYRPLVQGLIDRLGATMVGEACRTRPNDPGGLLNLLEQDDSCIRADRSSVELAHQISVIPQRRFSGARASGCPSGWSGRVIPSDTPHGPAVHGHLSFQKSSRAASLLWPV